MSKKRKLKKNVTVAITAAVVIIAAVILIAILKNKPQTSVASSSSSVQSSSEAQQSSSSTPVSSTPASSGTGSSSSSAVNIVHDFGILMLVNKNNALPSNYTPNLITIPKSYYYTTDKDNHFDSRAATYLENMIDAGRKAGLSDLCILSGYRTYAYQQNNFDQHVKSYEASGETNAQAKIDAAKLVAPPGTSEHETGLAADVISSAWYKRNGTLTADFDNTDAGKWLRANCVNYGFILRYPEDKVDVTKYDYESWHFRFVGVDDAKKITDSGLCLEEYVAKN
jgi:zinc D-Ala-D-Ala carboxypeptidase